MIPTVGSNKYLVATEQQVCSFETAQCLRVLGLPQNTFWYWMRYKHRGAKPSLINGNRFPEEDNVVHYAAYTLSDFVAVLPLMCWDKHDPERVVNQGQWKPYTAWYPSQKHYDLLSSSKIREIPYFSGKTLIEAVSKLVIYVYENKMVV